MSIWLRYLAVAALVGNGFTLLWSLIALGRTIQIDALGASEIGLIGFNLVFSAAAITLAALIAAPARRGVGTSTKVIAIPSIVSGGLGVVSAAMGLYARAGQPEIGTSTDGLAVLVDALSLERNVQGVFFSACTLALAILVICQRRLKSGPLLSETPSR